MPTSGECGRAETITFNPSEKGAVPGVVEAVLGIPVSGLSAGGNFTLLVTDAGLLSFGTNICGQLGRETDGSFDPFPAPVDLHLLSGATDSGGVFVKNLSCGSDHSILALSDGSVWVWGKGTQAQLGLGAQTKNVTRPVPLPCSGDLKGILGRKP